MRFLHIVGGPKMYVMRRGFLERPGTAPEASEYHRRSTSGAFGRDRTAVGPVALAPIPVAEPCVPRYARRIRGAFDRDTP